MTEFGISGLPRSIRSFVDLAKVTEECGFDAFGVGDGHFLHHDVYPVITVALLATEAIKIAPTTSNTVARSWSVHAASARALDELSPGRFVLGLATGDGSVRSIGKVPQRWSDLQADVEAIRAHTPVTLQIQCTASGLRGATSAGVWADSLQVGTGADATAISNLAHAAQEGRAQEGARNAPLAIWAMIIPVVVDHEADIPAAREAMRMGAYACAHFAFASTFEGKNVPVEYQDVIRDHLAHYDYDYHGVPGENPNARLLDNRPDVADYLLDRMCVIGTAQQVRTRLRSLIVQAELDGLWFPAQEIEDIRRIAAVVDIGRAREAS
jgi:alkanesulfonate monooxygenase SsuD/methylene tetrahydromethanopterin reductase-like flavin-dependent oxidoreductase (luciferase family)